MKTHIFKLTALSITVGLLFTTLSFAAFCPKPSQFTKKGNNWVAKTGKQQWKSANPIHPQASKIVKFTGAAAMADKNNKMSVLAKHFHCLYADNHGEEEVLIEPNFKNIKVLTNKYWRRRTVVNNDMWICDPNKKNPSVSNCPFKIK